MVTTLMLIKYIITEPASFIFKKCAENNTFCLHRDNLTQMQKIQNMHQSNSFYFCMLPSNDYI